MNRSGRTITQTEPSAFGVRPPVEGGNRRAGSRHLGYACALQCEWRSFVDAADHFARGHDPPAPRADPLLVGLPVAGRPSLGPEEETAIQTLKPDDKDLTAPALAGLSGTLLRREGPTLLVREPLLPLAGPPRGEAAAMVSPFRRIREERPLFRARPAGSAEPGIVFGPVDLQAAHHFQMPFPPPPSMISSHAGDSRRVVEEGAQRSPIRTAHPIHWRFVIASDRESLHGIA